MPMTSVMVHSDNGCARWASVRRKPAGYTSDLGRRFTFGKQGQFHARPTCDEQQNVVADHALRQVLVGTFDGGGDQAVGPAGARGRGASTYIDR